MADNELIVYLKSQYGQMKQGMDEAQRIVTDTVNHMGHDFQRLNADLSSVTSMMTSTLATIGPMIAAALSVEGFKSCIEGALQYNESILTLSRTMGMTTQAASTMNAALTIIGETTGEMIELSATVILENVVCAGICIKNCPRANYFYWREVWLKRV